MTCPNCQSQTRVGSTKDEDGTEDLALFCTNPECLNFDEALY